MHRTYGFPWQTFRAAASLPPWRRRPLDNFPDAFGMVQVEGSEARGTLTLLTLKPKAAGAAAGSSAGGRGGGGGM